MLPITPLPLGGNASCWSPYAREHRYHHSQLQLEHSEATHNHPIKNATSRDLPEYDPYTVHAKCQTTKGAGGGGTRKTVGSYHPSGTRDFTTRESATLQGLPTDFDLGPEGLMNKGNCKNRLGIWCRHRWRERCLLR